MDITAPGRCTTQQPAESVLNAVAVWSDQTFVASRVLLDWSLSVDGSSGTVEMGALHGVWTYPLQFPWSEARDAGGAITLRVRAFDRAGGSAVSPPLTVTLAPCNFDAAPVIQWVSDPGAQGIVLRQDSPNCYQAPKSQTVLWPIVKVTDDRDQYLDVRVHWSGFASGSHIMVPDGFWYGQVGPILYTSEGGGTLNVWVTATDSSGTTTTLPGTPVTVIPCAPQPR
jgi:hypothetical protein